MNKTTDLSIEQYRDLAEFREKIRKFLHFSESIAKRNGIEPQQHQLMLAVHGLPGGLKPTIRELSRRLHIQHHSAVELVSRLEQTGAIARAANEKDRREVWIELTPKGHRILRKLAVAHRDELERTGPELAKALQSVLRHRTKLVAF